VDKIGPFPEGMITNFPSPKAISHQTLVAGKVIVYQVLASSFEMAA